MKTHAGRLQSILLRTCGALLVVFWGAAAQASSGIDVDSNEVTEAPPTPELPSPSLNVPVLDRDLADAGNHVGKPAAATRTDKSAEKVVAPALADDVEDADDASGPVSTPPETALRLPGVAEEDLPRFRRQMYRTDI